MEFFPQEGKYHFDGHRNCSIRLDPEETIRLGGICPHCGRKLTLGVMHRVVELADEVLWIPEAPWLINPIIAVVPLQILAYHIAAMRGLDVDQPRNLAKSVTVE